MVCQEAMLSCPGLYNNLGAYRAAQVKKIQEGCGVVGQFFLGEHQGAAVSPSPRWRLTKTAPGTPLYVPGAPWAVRGTAGTHAPAGQ